ncbi:MAG: glycine cleavage system protein GcvH [Spirochaetes bacterium]|nr:MAG: glycine cleavage system protein GcvH [Spirochaetota bacterium]
MKEEELKFTKNHLWVYIDNSNATVGLSDYAQKELGDIVFVEMPEKGKSVKKDEVVGTVESVKSVSDLISPLSGEIIDFNKQLEDTPELINKDPYGEGWVFKIKISDSSEISDLMDYQAYSKFTEEQT